MNRPYYPILRVSNKHLERNLLSNDRQYAKECAKEIKRRKMVHLYIEEKDEWFVDPASSSYEEKEVIIGSTETITPKRKVEKRMAGRGR